MRICMICGTQPWHRPCPAMAALLAVFALTPLGQRCVVWRNAKVRSSRKLSQTPVTSGRPRVTSLGIDAINANLAAQPSDGSPAGPLDDISHPAPAVVILDGARPMLRGERIPLEDLRSASDMAHGIGEGRLPIYYRHQNFSGDVSLMLKHDASLNSIARLNTNHRRQQKYYDALSNVGCRSPLDARSAISQSCRQRRIRSLIMSSRRPVQRTLQHPTAMTREPGSTMYFLARRLPYTLEICRYLKNSGTRLCKRN